MQQGLAEGGESIPPSKVHFQEIWLSEPPHFLCLFLFATQSGWQLETVVSFLPEVVWRLWICKSLIFPS